MKTRRRVLVCPLDWGLGHATRCIPLIRELQEQGAEVVIGAEGRPLDLLRQEFPSIEFFVFPGYRIAYPSGSSSMMLSMLRQAPSILRRIREEHRELELRIRQHSVHGIISDNRYGLWSDTVPSVFITHQVMVKCPPLFRWAEPFTYRATGHYIKKYTSCWIPDLEGSGSLSGDLSHRYPLPPNAEFIGTLSRFRSAGEPSSPRYDILVLLSGPEPQRTLLEKKLSAQLSGMSSLRTCFVRGIPGGESAVEGLEGVTVHAHLQAEALEELIQSSSLVISRPGYSTVMDLARLGKKALFIPTPGQTEQEYLAAWYRERGLFYSEPQETVELQRAVSEAEKFTGIASAGSTLFKDKIKDFLDRL
jgi:UDP-N-acetylglucosamine transferase subunit ALG13